MTSEQDLAQVGKTPEPGGDPEDKRGRLKLTDPKAIRALAHPVRLALLEAIGQAGTLTATQASEMLGESPANCAFHLRTLAKYGFVEEAGGGRGRERPWRATSESFRIRLSSANLESEQAHVAAGALEQVIHDRWFARAKEAFAARGWSAEWEEAAGSSETLTFMTADELKAVREEMAAILLRHLDLRRVDPTKRPPGALPVSIVSFAFPRLDLAAPLAAETDEADLDEDFDEDAELDQDSAE